MRSCLLVVLALFGCGDEKKSDSPKQTADKGLTDGKRDLAKLAVDKLANEGYPRWALQHTDSVCPESLEPLVEIIGGAPEDARDPWGTPYRMVCGANVPAGTPRGGIAVDSAGPDRKRETADDIASWKQ